MARKRKQTRSNTRRNNARPTRRRNRAMVNNMGLDAPALAYRALLQDPCGSNLVQPTFAGTGSGYLLRTRQRQPLTTNVDWLVEFTPALAGFGFRFCGTTTAGAAYGNGVNVGPPAFLDLNSVKSYRCVAACLKCFYTGPELSRQGEVSLGLKNSYNVNVSAAPFPDGLSYAKIAVASTRTERLGEGVLEVNWVPSLNDESFVQPSATLIEAEGNTIFIAGQNTVPNSIIIELTAVWEWVPLANGTTGSVVPSIQAPRSRNSTNQVLQTLGDIAGWATNGGAHHTIANITSAVNSVSRVGREAMRVVGPVAATLTPWAAGLI